MKRAVAWIAAALLAISWALMLRALMQSAPEEKAVMPEVQILVLEREEAEKPAWMPVGECRIYHYCGCRECCGKADGITKTGTEATMGRTVAVDPAVIPLGSEVLINGVVYRAEDTGVHGHTIDLYIESHEQAAAMGTYLTNVSWR